MAVFPNPTQGYLSDDRLGLLVLATSETNETSETDETRIARDITRVLELLGISRILLDLLGFTRILLDLLGFARSIPRFAGVFLEMSPSFTDFSDFPGRLFLVISRSCIHS